MKGDHTRVVDQTLSMTKISLEATLLLVFFLIKNELVITTVAYEQVRKRQNMAREHAPYKNG